MRASYESRLPRRKCVKIIRPESLKWLTLGPLDDRPLVVTIHRHEGRTISCAEENCPFCQAFWTQEERVVIPCLFGEPARRGVLEVPVSHLEQLVGVTNQFHTLRALVIHCRRKNGRKNGPIEWRFFPRQAGERERCTGWNWLGELEETWAANTAKAYSTITDEKTDAKNAPCCDISARPEL